MRKTDQTTRLSQRARLSRQLLSRQLRVAACLVGIGLCLAAGAARAGDDDEEDDSSFEDKIIRNLMSGIGGTNMDNRGIDYRERSPLVMPRSADLPPPQTGAKATKNTPNWPNDPTVAARKAAAAANKERKATDMELSMPLMPSELAPKKTAAARESTVQQPGGNDGTQGGNAGGPMLSPSQLGFNGGMMSIFKGSKQEAAKFKGEPTRENLTQPPVGYQTPSPDYAYGTGPAVPIDKQTDSGVVPNMNPNARN